MKQQPTARILFEQEPRPGMPQPKNQVTAPALFQIDDRALVRTTGREVIVTECWLTPSASGSGFWCYRVKYVGSAGSVMMLEDYLQHKKV